MMTDVPPLLQSLVRALAASPSEDAAACAAAVRRVLAGEVEGLDDAFGLKPGPGERSWRSEAARAERDRLIRETAAAFFPGMSLRETAEAIAKGLDRFHEADWKRSRSAVQCPFQPGMKANYWLIFKAVDRQLSAARLRQILAN